jgi:hypothetical protein
VAAEIYRHISEKYLGIKFHGNLSNGGRVAPTGQTLQIAESPKNVSKWQGFLTKMASRRAW